MIARSMLIVALISCIYSGCRIVQMWPGSLWGLGLLAFFWVGKRGYRLTTLGSARWASLSDLVRAKMIGGTGLILGKAGLSKFQTLWGRDDSVRLNGVHTAVFAPTGVGKGVSLVIPFLLDCDESCVVIDFKGENARLTAERRRKMGHRVVMLDPFRVVTQKPDTFNPLDFIRKESRVALDECNDLAKALVVRTGEEKEPHWNDSAEAYISALAATVVGYGGKDDRNLESVRSILSNPGRLDLAIKLMLDADDWGGMLKPMGGQLTHFVDKEKASVLTSALRHLRFLGTPAVAESTAKSSFEPSQLRKGKMTVYLILPPEHMRAQAGLLRMWIAGLLRAVVREGLGEKQKVHFILDEAASLGHLEAIDDAVDKYRGYGVRLQFYFQSVGQVSKCFPEQEQTLFSNTSQVFFGVNDNQTAELVSNRLGDQTIVVDSGGQNWGDNRGQSIGSAYSSSTGSSDGNSRNWNQQARKLLNPDEVIALPPRVAITLTPGVRPIRTTLTRYYENNWLRRAWVSMQTFVTAAVLCAFALLVAVALSQ